MDPLIGTKPPHVSLFPLKGKPLPKAAKCEEGSYDGINSAWLTCGADYGDVLKNGVKRSPNPRSSFTMFKNNTHYSVPVSVEYIGWERFGSNVPTLCLESIADGVAARQPAEHLKKKPLKCYSTVRGSVNLAQTARDHSATLTLTFCSVLYTT